MIYGKILKKNLIFCGVFLLFSCQNEKQIPVDFYYWKTNVAFDSIEKQVFTDLNAEKLYIRFFDIDKIDGKNIISVGIISNFDKNELPACYVPTVFITNRVFQNLTEEKVNLLAEKTFAQIQQIAKSCNNMIFSEIQIDCDWTKSTKKAYFNFLKKLKNISNLQISCTLRLHQIKYSAQTDIPPVDNGVLMCYSISNPKDDEGINSILDIPLLKSYLSDCEHYTLPFDVALPLYSWAIVRNHLGKIKLINGITENELINENFIKISKNRYQVTDDFFFYGIYLNKGFIVDLEEITPEILAEAKNFIQKKLKNRDFHLVYFHLNTNFVTRFKLDEL